MSFISDYNKRKQTAIEYSKVLNREILPRDIRINKSGMILTLNLSAEESKILINYLKTKWQDRGYEYVVDDPVFEAQVDSMFSTQH